MSKSIHSNSLSSTKNSVGTSMETMGSIKPTGELFHQELGVILRKQHQNHCNVHEQPLHNFARYLRAARQNAGLTPVMLADIVGASEATIYALEHAMIRPSEIDFSLLWDIAEALDEDVNLFLILLERAHPAVRQSSWRTSFHGLISNFTPSRESSKVLFWFGTMWQNLKKIKTVASQNNGYYLRAYSGAVGIFCMFVIFYLGTPGLGTLEYPLSTIDYLQQASPTVEVTALPTISHSTNVPYKVSWGGNGDTVQDAVVIPIDTTQDAIFPAKGIKLKPLITCQERSLTQLTQDELCPV